MELLTITDLCRRAGLSHADADKLVRNGLFQPMPKQTGSGNVRRFSEVVVFAAKVYVALRDADLDPAARIAGARKVADCDVSASLARGDRYLVVRRGEADVVSGDAMNALLGEGSFVLDIRTAWERFVAGSNANTEPVLAGARR